MSVSPSVPAPQHSEESEQPTSYRSDHGPHHRPVQPHLSIQTSRRKWQKDSMVHRFSLSDAYERSIIRFVLPLLTVPISQICVSSLRPLHSQSRWDAGTVRRHGQSGSLASVSINCPALYMVSVGSFPDPHLPLHSLSHGFFPVPPRPPSLDHLRSILVPHASLRVLPPPFPTPRPSAQSFALL